MSTLFYDSANGRVGIGTASPISALHVNGGDIFASSNINGNAGNTTWRLQPQYVNSAPFNSILRIANGWDPIAGTGTASYAASGINLNCFQGGSQIEFFTSATNNATPTERMRINSSGNVGIRTNDPKCILHIYNSAENPYHTMFDGSLANNVLAKALLQTAISSSATLCPTQYAGTLYLFWRAGTSYYYATVAGTSYFTGQHAGVPNNEDIKINVQNYVGLIVSAADTGYVSYTSDGTRLTDKEAIQINEALPNVVLSTKDNDKAVFGVITNLKDNGQSPYNTDGKFDYDHIDNGFENGLKDRIRINSFGEGAVWVSNINGNIENGDYITSSIIPGVGKRQDDDLLHNYTVAKSTMSCDFLLNSPKYLSEEYIFNGTTYIKAFIGCTYHCG